MINFNATDLQADFAQMVEDGPVTFTYLGTDYQGLRSDIALTQTTTFPGMIRNYDFQLIVSESVLATVNISKPITIAGRRYKIVGVTPDPMTGVTTYDMAGQNK
jgi:hypothetical protein